MSCNSRMLNCRRLAQARRRCATMRSASTTSTSTTAPASTLRRHCRSLPGNEGAGEVVAVGKGVKDFKPGDRVAYTSTLGSYAEERNVEVKHLVKLPKSISYDTGAAMMLKGLTAQYLLRQTYRVKEGDTILVHAAAGGVGQILCQWGKALGAIVIGTVGSEDKAKIAKKAGAKHVILYRDEDFAVRVKELTKGAKCAVVYDGVGKATFPASLDCLAPFGMFASYGSASGGIQVLSTWRCFRKKDRCSRPVRRSLPFSPIARGSTGWRAISSRSSPTGDVKIPVSQKAPLAEAARLHAALESRQTTGSLVLHP